MSKVQVVAGLLLMVLAVLTSVSSDAFALDNQVGFVDGDSCEIDRNGSKIPGKVKGIECCNNLDSNDCVVILKPFPTNSAKPKLKINKKLNSGEIKSNP